MKEHLIAAAVAAAVAVPVAAQVTITGNMDVGQIQQKTTVTNVGNALNATSTRTLTALKLVASKRPTKLPPVVVRRRKLTAKIWEQIQLAQCEATGERYQPTRLRTMHDRDTGVVKTLEVPKRVKPLWCISDTGKVCLSIRYGSKVLELSRGKAAVEVATPDDLVATPEAVRGAVEAGELESQIEAASGALRSAFKR